MESDKYHYTKYLKFTLKYVGKSSESKDTVVNEFFRLVKNKNLFNPGAQKIIWTGEKPILYYNKKEPIRLSILMILFIFIWGFGATMILAIFSMLKIRLIFQLLLQAVPQIIYLFVIIIFYYLLVDKYIPTITSSKEINYLKEKNGLIEIYYSITKDDDETYGGSDAERLYSRLINSRKFKVINKEYSYNKPIE